MSGMIYVDFDDVICETARFFVKLLKENTGKVVQYEAIESHDLGKPFGLSAPELSAFMNVAHEYKMLLKIDPVKDAVNSLKVLKSYGYEINIITGRPPSTYDASLKWLANHHTPCSNLTFVDKYARYDIRQSNEHTISKEALIDLKFEVAIEDSPVMAEFLLNNTSVPVILFERPWNRFYKPSIELLPRLLRCSTWSEIMANFSGMRKLQLIKGDVC